mgnify:CR=1 FL=1
MNEHGQPTGRAWPVNLTAANLSGTLLVQADLTGANLSEAYLRGSLLTAAVLSRADLAKADLRQAVLVFGGAVEGQGFFPEGDGPVPFGALEGQGTEGNLPGQQGSVHRQPR